MELISGKQSEIDDLNSRATQLVADHDFAVAQLNGDF